MSQIHSDPSPPPLRKFTIFDGHLITIVMAAASLAARSSLADTGRVVGSLQFWRLTEADYVTNVLLGEPTQPSQLGSVGVLMAATVYNSLVVHGSIRWAWMPDHGQAIYALRECVVLIFPILAYLSFALLFLRIIPPRPDWSRLVQLPGCVACVAVSISLLVASWVEAVTLQRVSLAVVAATVLASWLVLALTHRWQPEPSWVDRTGRALGICWLVVGLLAIA